MKFLGSLIGLVSFLVTPCFANPQLEGQGLAVAITRIKAEEDRIAKLNENSAKFLKNLNALTSEQLNAVLRPAIAVWAGALRLSLENEGHPYRGQSLSSRHSEEAIQSALELLNVMDLAQFKFESAKDGQIKARFLYLVAAPFAGGGIALAPSSPALGGVVIAVSAFINFLGLGVRFGSVGSVRVEFKESIPLLTAINSIWLEELNSLVAAFPQLNSAQYILAKGKGKKIIFSLENATRIAEAFIQALPPTISGKAASLCTLAVIENSPENSQLALPESTPNENF